MTTPEQLEEQIQRDKALRARAKLKSTLLKAVSQTGDVIKVNQLTGLDRINQSLNEKVESLKLQGTNQYIVLSEKLGIKNIDKDTPTLPETCPDRETLDEALRIRDNLVDSIESLIRYVNFIDKLLTIVNDAVSGTITTLTAINLLKITTSTTLKGLPVVPGILSTLITDLDDVRTILTFKNDGNPRLPELKRAVSTGVTYTAQVSITLTQILKLIQSVDVVLTNCGKTPKALTEQLPVTSTQPIDIPVYKGFTLSVVKQPFSNTVQQSVGQAKNNQNIVLLQTQPSFTSNPQVLIEELKFIIDRDNLKAD